MPRLLFHVLPIALQDADINSPLTEHFSSPVLKAHRQRLARSGLGDWKVLALLFLLGRR